MGRLNSQAVDVRTLPVHTKVDNIYGAIIQNKMDSKANGQVIKFVSLTGQKLDSPVDFEEARRAMRVYNYPVDTDMRGAIEDIVRTKSSDQYVIAYNRYRFAIVKRNL